LDRLTVRRYDLSQVREVLMSLDDADHTSRGAALLLANLTPGYKPLTVVEFDVRFDGGAYFITSNIDFPAANQIYQLAHPDSNLTPAFVLTHFFENLVNLKLAAEAGTEVAANSVDAALAAYHIECVIQKSLHNAGQVRRFQEAHPSWQVRCLRD